MTILALLLDAAASTARASSGAQWSSGGERSTLAMAWPSGGERSMDERVVKRASLAGGLGARLAVGLNSSYRHCVHAEKTTSAIKSAACRQARRGAGGAEAAIHSECAALARLAVFGQLFGARDVTGSKTDYQQYTYSSSHATAPAHMPPR